MWSLILAAYGNKLFYQFEKAPGWFADDYYQVRITASPPAVSTAQMEQLLLKEVLGACFALEARRIETPLPGFSLTIAETGVKFHAVAHAVPPATGDGTIHFSDMADLVPWLNQFYYAGKEYGVTRPVRDATGLRGTFDIPVPDPQPGSGINLLAELARLGIRAQPAPGVAIKYQIARVNRLTGSCTLP